MNNGVCRSAQSVLKATHGCVSLKVQNQTTSMHGVCVCVCSVARGVDNEHVDQLL